MLILANIPLLICLAGLILYLAVKDAKVADVGRIMFWTGLVFTLWFGVRHP